MNLFSVGACLLLLAALTSGILTFSARFRLWQEWRNAPAEVRNDMVLGMFGPAIHKIRATVPENEGLLLYSEIDPALFPYALFPRKIWQLQTDPETNSVYMDLPPSSYPRINPERLPVSWVLDIRLVTIAIGGELSRILTNGGLK
jgi:hypothetical protein